MECPHCKQKIAKIPLTKNMEKVYRYIKEYIEKNNMSPSYDDILEAMNMKSKSNVARYILSLQERGWISKEMYKARTLRLVA
jgi:SOS-response transcriptional repressor LexA